MPEFVTSDYQRDVFAIGSSFIQEVAEEAYTTLVWSEGIADGHTLDDSIVTAVFLAVCDFLSNNTVRDLIEEHGLSAEFIGHNLILSGNHHGAGFWDSPYPKPVGDALHSYAVGVEVYEGDNGTWYA